MDNNGKAKPAKYESVPPIVKTWHDIPWDAFLRFFLSVVQFYTLREISQTHSSLPYVSLALSPQETCLRNTMSSRWFDRVVRSGVIKTSMKSWYFPVAVHQISRLCDCYRYSCRRKGPYLSDVDNNGKAKPAKYESVPPIVKTWDDIPWDAFLRFFLSVVQFYTLREISQTHSSLPYFSPALSPQETCLRNTMSSRWFDPVVRSGVIKTSMKSWYFPVAVHQISRLCDCYRYRCRRKGPYLSDVDNNGKAKPAKYEPVPPIVKMWDDIPRHAFFRFFCP